MDPESAELLDGGRGGARRAALPDRGHAPRPGDGGFVAPPERSDPRARRAAEPRGGAGARRRRSPTPLPLPPHLLDEVVERAAGNPQFLLDLLLAAGDADGEPLPDSIEAAAMARLDRLAHHDRALVRCASVLSLSFHPRLLDAEFLGDVPVPDEATWERLSGLFADDGDGHLRFRHPVVRDAAYAVLPFATRRRLHRVAGVRLEREFGDEADEAGGLLSLHFLLAGDHERAYRYARTAADRAAEQLRVRGRRARCTAAR